MLFFNQVKYDYLQRIRSYRFLIVLGVSLVLGFLFIPAPDATYETVTLGNYKGEYNAAWIAIVSALMASTFVSLLGFYVINNGIKKDIETRVGHILATTQATNFRYLISKVISNFLVLATMILVMALMNVGLFFLYNTGFSFDPLQFVMAYLFVPLPAMFFVACMAVVMEVLFKERSVLQNVAYFFFFGFISVQGAQNGGSGLVDLLGTDFATGGLIDQINAFTGEEKEYSLNIGFRLGSTQRNIPFVFEGMSFTLIDVAKRLLWVLIGLILTFSVARFFHRFDLKERLNVKKKKVILETAAVKDLDLGQLPGVDRAYGLWPLLKVEFLLLIRQGSRWLWGLNLIAMILLVVLDLQIAHTIVLPILWFLQVSRLSDLTTKERQHNVHQFSFAAYKPISRVYAAQLLAGIGLVILLAMPLVLRHAMAMDLQKVIGPILGSIFVVGLSATSAFVSGGKKLFEVLFFFLTYCNVNGLPFLDYFGAVNGGSSYYLGLLMVSLALLVASIMSRRYQLRSL